MIGQLHTGIACLCLACQDSMSSFLAYDWVITNGCYNPFGVSSYYGMAQLIVLFVIHVYT